MAQLVKNTPAMQETDCNTGEVGLIPGLGRSTPVFLPGKFHGQRCLVGYSPWGRTESDTTEPLTLFKLQSVAWC